jgi:hypothetical protein
LVIRVDGIFRGHAGRYPGDLLAGVGFVESERWPEPRESAALALEDHWICISYCEDSGGRKLYEFGTIWNRSHNIGMYSMNLGKTLGMAESQLYAQLT